MEFAFPLRLKRYAVRRGSGGDGKFKGKLPEDQSKLIEGGIYVGDGDEKGTYKILYEIDATGTPKFLRNLF